MRYFFLIFLILNIVACAGIEVKPKGEVVVGGEIGGRN